MIEDRPGVRALVVEDDPTDALLLHEALKRVPRASFTTTRVETLEDALARLATTDFDIVLLDLGLPDSQGPDTLTRLCEHQPQVPVVVLTGLDDEAVGISAMQLGAQDYLVKGNSPPPLLGRSIRYAIERHRSALALRGSEARLSGLISSAMDAIITVDNQQRITLFNPAAEQTFGCKAREVLGQTLDRLIPERFRSTRNGDFRSPLHPGGNLKSPLERLFGQIDLRRWKTDRLGLIYGLRADGTEFPMETSISQVEVRGQKLYTAILRDISERKRAEEAMMAQLKESAITEERNRMAGEIHDTLAQGLAGVVLQLEAARSVNETSPREATEIIERAEAIARASLAEAKRSVWALHPPELEAEGLVGAVRGFLDRIAAGGPTAVEFSLRGNPFPLPNDAALGLLRICQEAVVNALRHAKASKILVQLTYEPSVVDLCVQDNGRGLDSQVGRAGKGFGLTSMRERAERIGAQIEISGEPGHGTRMTVVARPPKRDAQCQTP